MSRKEAQTSQNEKYKLQFIIDKDTFERFEALRKGKFSCTSKQHLLLNEMFLPWLERIERAIKD